MGVKQNSAGNIELRDLGTHMAGAPDLHETIHTDSPVQVEAPVVPNPGPYDTRTGSFELHTEEELTESEDESAD